jgi:hypothetical protein
MGLHDLAKGALAKKLRYLVWNLVSYGRISGLEGKDIHLSVRSESGITM